MHGAFQKLVTWGSPHHGSALVTAEYVFTADPAYSVGAEDVPGIGVPLQNIDLVRSCISGKAVDTPGNRDLRWDNKRPLRLDDWFSMDAGQYPDRSLWTKYDLQNGTWLYNENLRLLNTNDIYNYLTAPVNRLQKNKYVFLYGITSEMATASRSLIWGTYRFKASSPIAQGAFLNSKFIKNPDDAYEGVPLSSNDAASPVVSMAAEGMVGYRASLGDIDHEEYFGAPTGPGTFTTPGKAESTAQATLGWLEINDKAYACPTGGSVMIGYGDSNLVGFGAMNVYGKLTWKSKTSFTGQYQYTYSDGSVLQDSITGEVSEDWKTISVSGQSVQTAQSCPTCSIREYKYVFEIKGLPGGSSVSWHDSDETFEWYVTDPDVLRQAVANLVYTEAVTDKEGKRRVARELTPSFIDPGLMIKFCSNEESEDCGTKPCQ